MKLISAVLVLACLISGCASGPDPMEQALAFRQTLLQAKSCSFSARISADYGDRLFGFSAACQMDSEGTLSFEITSPETLDGICGTIDGDGGMLQYEDTGIAFPLLAEGLASPVSAPWLLLMTLKKGYIRTVGQDEDLIWLRIDDSYDTQALGLDIWMDSAWHPVRCEILQDGIRIVSMDVTDFQIV